MKYNKFWRFILNNIWILGFSGIFGYIFYMMFIYSKYGYQKDIEQYYTTLGLWVTFTPVFITIVLNNIALRLKWKSQIRKLTMGELAELASNETPTTIGDKKWESGFVVGFTKGYLKAEKKFTELKID